MNPKIAIVIAAALVAVTVALADRPATSASGRYAIASSSGIAYRLNVDTGDVHFCDTGGCRPLLRHPTGARPRE